MTVASDGEQGEPAAAAGSVCEHHPPPRGRSPALLGLQEGSGFVSAFTSPPPNGGFASRERLSNPRHQASESTLFSNLLSIVKDAHFLVVWRNSDLSISM